MISKKHRFHGRGSLSYVYKNGLSERVEFFAIKHVKSKTDKYRLAVVVSKKVNKKAVVRNRIRRRIYEVVRNIYKDFGFSQPSDIIITVFDDSVANISTQDLNNSISKLLTKTKII